VHVKPPSLRFRIETNFVRLAELVWSSFFCPPRESERAKSFFRPRRHGTGCGGAGGPRDVDVSGQKNENVAARAPSESLGVDEFRIGISSPCCCWWMSGGVERKRDAQMAMGGSWKKWRRCKRVEIFWLTPTCLVCIRPCKPFWRCIVLIWGRGG
jgi:hypothetical protein